MKKLIPLLLTFISIYSFSQNSLSFDGINDYVNCGNHSSLNITGTAITLEAWIYPTSWKTQVWQGNIISKESPVGTGYMLRAGAGGKLNINVGSGGPWNELTSSSNVLTLNTWNHVAGTYDGSFLRLYVNGILTDSLSKTITMAGTATQNLYLGESPAYPGRYFPGRIDEVRIWNVVRTQSEIQADMNSELCVVPSSVKAYYTLNHGTAGGTNTTVTSVTDYSANTNTGTLFNFTLSGTSSNWVAGKNIVPGVITGSNNISACGSYTMPDGRVITTAGTYYDTLPSSTPCDSLVAYIITFPPAIIRNTVNDSGCVTYTTSMGTIITTSGTYYDTVSTSAGCDTTVRYNIVISGSVNDSVFRNGARIEAWDTWADHQWVRCDSNFKPIAGATSKFYIVPGDGDYAVIVKRGVCIDTSDCININTASLNKNIFEKVKVFPNPTSSEIILNNLPLESKIKIISVEGKVISTFNNQKTLDVSNLSNGLYYIELTSKKERKLLKFVKQ
ncbi:MAG: LamG-like jellyroll fold domain-containing protein [Flavobacteriales bacterium]